MRLIDRQPSHTQMSFTARMLGARAPHGNPHSAAWPARRGRGARRRYSGGVTSPNPSSRPGAPVEYKGEPLDAARGPGLGCFWFQMVVLAALVVATPLTVGSVPMPVTIAMFVAMLLLLLVSGQTMIFLLRLVAASRTEGRRRPLASASPTVGELEDVPLSEGGSEPPSDPGEPRPATADGPDAAADARSDAPGMRQ
jgi:hypothetical protein